MQQVWLGQVHTALLLKAFALKVRGESDTVSVGFRESARYVRLAHFV